MGMEAFYTRDKANEGRKLTLYAPDGSPTDEWLMVRHAWSEAFQDAEDAGLRESREAVMALGESPDPAAMKAIERRTRVKMLASLVAGWSFEAECTPEAVAEFLHRAPQIADKIDEFAGDAKSFFGDESRRSRRGSKAKSD